VQRRSVLLGLTASGLCAGLNAFASTEKHYDVIIVGAGLSGLNAAYQLDKAGYNVLVLEAKNRVGGRILTLNSVKSHPEAGGQQIGHGYGLMRTMATDLGLELEGMGDFARTSKFIINDQFLSASEWPTHQLNRLNLQEKHISPSSLYYHYIKKADGFTFPSDWTANKHAHLDISLYQLFKQLGASEQALTLINANLNANNLQQLSAVDAIYRYRLAVSSGRGKSHRIKGGNSKFTETLAKKLSTKILLNKPVVNIIDGRSVTVKCADGSTYIANKAIISLPFSVLKDIQISGKLSAVKTQAIQQAQYTQISQVLFEVDAGFDKQDSVFSHLWSDDTFGRVFTSADASGQVSNMLSWINGDAAIKLDKLTDSDAISVVQKSIESAVPAIKGKLKAAHYQSWGKDPFAKGAYIHFGPGQVQQLVKHVAKPEGNLHFAGEHTEFDYPGMESALVSGLRASQEIKQLLL